MQKGRTVFALGIGLAGVLLTLAHARANNEFTDAVTRSQSAGEIVASVSHLPESGLPKELVDKAQAVGVFPLVKKDIIEPLTPVIFGANGVYATARLTTVMEGSGVISARAGGGWSLPAYYKFTGGYDNPFEKDERFSVVLLFMTQDAVDLFEKGGAVRMGKKPPRYNVKTLREAELKELEGAHIVAYAYSNAGLKRILFTRSFSEGFSITPDNNINTPLYGVKGREVLAGAKINTVPLQTGISAFQEALQNHYGAAK